MGCRGAHAEHDDGTHPLACRHIRPQRADDCLHVRPRRIPRAPYRRPAQELRLRAVHPPTAAGLLIQVGA